MLLSGTKDKVVPKNIFQKRISIRVHAGDALPETTDTVVFTF